VMATCTQSVRAGDGAAPVDVSVRLVASRDHPSVIVMGAVFGMRGPGDSSSDDHLTVGELSALARGTPLGEPIAIAPEDLQPDAPAAIARVAVDGAESAVLVATVPPGGAAGQGPAPEALLRAAVATL
jgi:hypothetical protein